MAAADSTPDLRVLHTADWHLGHTLHGHGRQAEHGAFLDWLIETLVEERIDALLVAGDIFDHSNPSAEAQRQYYGFLVRTRARLPELDIVVIAGNHDSAGRLDAPRELLGAFGVRVVGQPPAGGVVEPVPLHRADGTVGGHALPVPFLRPGDLPQRSVSEYAAGVAEAYRAATARLIATTGADQARIALGHLHIRGGAISEQSERALVIGGEEALPTSIFPPELDYVALGHLHRPQALDGGRVRYSGSPLPLSFSEIGYKHQVLSLAFRQGRLHEAREIAVPRPAPLLRVPSKHAPLGEALAALGALDVGAPAAGLEPLLEVRVELEAHDPSLRKQIEDALEGKPVRLAHIDRARRGGAGGAAGADEPRLRLADLRPDLLFERLWRGEHGDEAPPPEVRDAFRQLLDDAHQEVA